MPTPPNVILCWLPRQPSRGISLHVAPSGLWHVARPGRCPQAMPRGNACRPFRARACRPTRANTPGRCPGVMHVAPSGLWHVAPSGLWHVAPSGLAHDAPSGLWHVAPSGLWHVAAYLHASVVHLGMNGIYRRTSINNTPLRPLRPLCEIHEICWQAQGDSTLWLHATGMD